MLRHRMRFAGEARGLCKSHYYRWRKSTVDIEEFKRGLVELGGRAPPGSFARRGRVCSERGCGRPIMGRGLCDGHFRMAMREEPLRPIRGYTRRGSRPNTVTRWSLELSDVCVRTIEEESEDLGIIPAHVIGALLGDWYDATRSVLATVPAQGKVSRYRIFGAEPACMKALASIAAFLNLSAGALIAAMLEDWCERLGDEDDPALRVPHTDELEHLWVIPRDARALLANKRRFPRGRGKPGGHR